MDAVQKRVQEYEDGIELQWFHRRTEKDKEEQHTHQNDCGSGDKKIGSKVSSREIVRSDNMPFIELVARLRIVDCKQLKSFARSHYGTLKEPRTYGMHNVHHQRRADQHQAQQTKSLTIFFGKHLLGWIIQEKVEQREHDEEVQQHKTRIVSGQCKEHTQQNLNKTVNTNHRQLSAKIVHLRNGEDKAESKRHIHHIAQRIPEKAGRYEQEKRGEKCRTPVECFQNQNREIENEQPTKNGTQSMTDSERGIHVQCPADGIYH